MTLRTMPSATSGVATDATEDLLPNGPLEPTSWMDYALCAGMDTDYFFNDAGTGKKEQRAATLCAGCPVREECLEWAIVTEQRYGVWGGMPAKTRRREIANRRRLERFRTAAVQTARAEARERWGLD